MKFVIAVLCLLTACIHAQAQRRHYESVQYASITPIRLQQVVPLRVETGNLPGQHGIRTGKTLTIIGGILLVGGVALASTADELYYSSNTTNGTTTEEGDPQGAIGALMVVGGAGMIIPGIIIWSKSKKRYNRYLIDHPQQSLQLDLGGGGVGMSYRF